MIAAIPFAGLAPDSRSRRGSGELSRFDLAGALDVSAALRKASSGEATTSRVASALLEAVNAYEHDARPASVLLRLFVTRRASQLPPELRPFLDVSWPGATAGADPLCLLLVASQGIEPDWNDVAKAGPAAVIVLDEIGRAHV